ncbi:Rieske 2Fe-2S domain-containing protein [Streptomyces varsoviensis]|uniref:Rieske 2Fe-2S domain-containing protein n=1 Tax=Streptomyces varsoviensis TaxID=67373 RepID=UPI0033DBF0C8
MLRRSPRFCTPAPFSQVSTAHQHGEVPLPTPNGWFCMGFSTEIPPGTVVSRPLAGQDVVLYRTRSGLLRATRPYCPHLGAHLGLGGRIDGEDIICPFHRFAFGPDGACTRTSQAGYGPRTPKASLNLLPVRETDGLILVWHHHNSAPPTWEIPHLPVDWNGRLKFRAMEFAGHPQDILENSQDPAHLVVLHGRERYITAHCAAPPAADGPCLRSKLDMSVRIPGTRRTRGYQYEFTQYGTGYVTVDIRLGPTLTRIWVTVTPISDWRVHFRIAARTHIPASRHRPPTLSRISATAMASAIQWAHHAVTFSPRIGDGPIFATRGHNPRPHLAQGDGPITRYRHWAQQFYPDSPAHPDSKEPV